MTEPRLPDYLDYMLKAAGLAREYVGDTSKDAFFADSRTQHAVALNLVIIGEAATEIARDHPDFVDPHPEVPWREMRGMRNRIAHGYFDMQLDVVWQTLQSALPRLVAQLLSIRDAEGV